MLNSGVTWRLVYLCLIACLLNLGLKQKYWCTTDTTVATSQTRFKGFADFFYSGPIVGPINLLINPHFYPTLCQKVDFLADFFFFLGGEGVLGCDYMAAGLVPQAAQNPLPVQ